MATYDVTSNICQALAEGSGAPANVSSASGDISLSATMGRLLIDSLQGAHFPKGSAGAVTAAGLLSLRGQEGATLDAGVGLATVNGATGVSIQAGGAFGGGGDANITSASGDVSLSAPAGRLLIDSLQGAHFPKGSAGALTAAGLVSVRGREGATMVADDGTAAVKGSTVLIEAGGSNALAGVDALGGDGGGGGGEGVAAVAMMKASSSVVEASGATGVSISAPAGVGIRSGGDDGGGGGVTVASAAGVTLSSAGGGGAGTGIVLDAGKTEKGTWRGVVIAGRAFPSFIFRLTLSTSGNSFLFHHNLRDGTTQFWWGGQMGMVRSAVRSRSLSLRHTQITKVNLPDWEVDLTVIYMGDLLLTQEIPNPRLNPPPELRSILLGNIFEQWGIPQTLHSLLTQ